MTAWEKFNWMWDTHGHGSAKSWVKAQLGELATPMIELKRDRSRGRRRIL